MATVLEPKTRTDTKETSKVDLDGFLAGLGDLSRSFGLAITDGAQIYVMEPEDYARSYTASGESDLSFA